MAGAGTGPLVPNWPHNSTGVQPVTGDMVPFVESCVCDGTATHDPARSCDWLQLGPAGSRALQLMSAKPIARPEIVSSERTLYACATDANFWPSMLRRRPA